MNGISFSNLEWLDRLYEQYLGDPASVGTSWGQFFAGWDLALSLAPQGGDNSLKIDHLIQSYRMYGHLAADVNPLKVGVDKVAELSLEGVGSLDGLFPTCGLLKEKVAPLRVIVEKLQRIYAGSMGIEYMGIRGPELEKWVQERLEGEEPLGLSVEEKKSILQDLNKAELFEWFIHTKYVGQKRFSLEGGETLIPVFEMILERASDEGVSEAIIGMSHRGRLNVLANIMNKSYGAIFSEFEDHYAPALGEGTGDVKYHKGFTGHLTTKKGKTVFVTLSANPSHLEAVDPVVEGHTRARQEIKGKKEVIPILIHGDAALAGQGVVYETLQMGGLRGYETGGTLHIVVNNQIGFTTIPEDSRSTRYCTDIAKAFGAPVFHVNAEKPEECVLAAKLALEIRQRFHCDVFLDLNCYRKYGHNEGDEPAFTQPLEYRLIRSKKSIRELYIAQLSQENILTSEIAKQYEVEFREQLQKALESIPKEVVEAKGMPQAADVFLSYDTKVAEANLVELAHSFCSVPEGFHLHPKVKRLLDERLAMMKSSVDWGLAEHLAYASLLVEGASIRLSGQDVKRATFSQRHAVWIDQEEKDKTYTPLSHLKKGQGSFSVFNSELSEYAVLGFEFGYSLPQGKSLTIWEAQYGDFANGAQVMIDQFIAASEQKWGLPSNIALFLPHGYEGQGPEHSSARVERYLQLAGHGNMFVVNCSKPAQLFHLLRRQALLKNKKPLILFTPKALLRHPECVSPVKDFSQGAFEEFLEDVGASKSPRKILFCSGKVYYDLIAAKPPSDIAIIRVEQLYPFNEEKFKKMMGKYTGFKAVAWVQEEPENMGPASYICPILQKLLSMPVSYIGRERSASTAVGSHSVHEVHRAQLLKEALA